MELFANFCVCFFKQREIGCFSFKSHGMMFDLTRTACISAHRKLSHRYNYTDVKDDQVQKGEAMKQEIHKTLGNNGMQFKNVTL